ncbi:MAG: hypothetical protein CMJ58_07070 [Planctomycetaceae bacterium]|nr:hypothetical protein [Planctomycetaceae bacterium]
MVVSSSGCGACGKVRSWFHKGSPCGARVAPATLGAPITMAAPTMPMMAAPMQCIETAPMCVPCDPCGDPCADPCGSYSTGYYGGYASESGPGCAACEAAGSGQVIFDESQYIPRAPEGSVVTPPSDSRYTDPQPM